MYVYSILKKALFRAEMSTVVTEMSTVVLLPAPKKKLINIMQVLNEIVATRQGSAWFYVVSHSSDVPDAYCSIKIVDRQYEELSKLSW